jgi:long-subunit acyl-CoA synthetase (AMP-forming)
LEQRIAGTDMLYSSGTTGRPKGVALPFTAKPIGEAASGVLGLSQMLFAIDDTKVYL